MFYCFLPWCFGGCRRDGEYGGDEVGDGSEACGGYGVREGGCEVGEAPLDVVSVMMVLGMGAVAA